MKLIADPDTARHVTDRQWLTAMSDVTPENDCRIWWPDRPAAPMRLIRSGAVTTIDHDGTTRQALTGHPFTAILDDAARQADVEDESMRVAWEDQGLAHWYVALAGGRYVRGHVQSQIDSAAQREDLARRIAVGIDKIRGVHRGATP